MRTKQVIVMRTDLNMRKGKMAAQASHASMAFITRRLAISPTFVSADDGYTEMAVIFSPTEIEWLNNSFTKICVGVKSQDDLFAVHYAAAFAGIESRIIQDNGTTEFGGVPTYTCAAIGPDESSRIDEITGHLKLL